MIKTKNPAGLINIQRCGKPALMLLKFFLGRVLRRRESTRVEASIGAASDQPAVAIINGRRRRRQTADSPDSSVACLSFSGLRTSTW